jgi:hypothetical protein
MIVDCVADLHGFYPKLEGGDLLIVAGDLTRKDSPEEYLDFFIWIATQKYKKRILIAGNHDNFILEMPEVFNAISDFDYLCDSGTEFEYEERPCNFCRTRKECCENEKSCPTPWIKKIKIWGSPWTKSFRGMNPKCKAFTVDTEEELAEKWAKIPHDIDILVTHSPPQGGLDFTTIQNGMIVYGYGSKSLQMEYKRISPKLHVFGHIHEGYGQDKNGTTYLINASHVNERYEPVNKPIRVIL